MTDQPPLTQPPHAPHPPMRRIVATDLLLTVLAILVALRLALPFVAGLLSDQFAGFNKSYIIAGALLFQSAAVLLAIKFLVLDKRGITWRDLGLVRTSAAWCYGAIALALPLMLLVGMVNYVMISTVDQTFVNPQFDLIAPDGSAPGGFNWPGYLVTLFAAGVVAPFVEEVAFRGLLLQWLRVRTGTFLAVIITALLFGAMHGIPMLVPALSVAGAAFALIFVKTGSLWPAILLHGTFNMAMTTLLYVAISQGLPIAA